MLPSKQALDCAARRADLQLELLDQECFLWSADDQASAFNLYCLEDARLPYFVFGEPAEPATLKRLGVLAGRRWAAMSTLPMGWLSATGIMQHLAYRLTKEGCFRAGARDDTAEFSRGGLGRRWARVAALKICMTCNYTTTSSVSLSRRTRPRTWRARQLFSICSCTR